MRYHRQGFELPIDVSAAELAELTIPALVDRFNTIHRRLYGFGLEGGVEVVNLRALARGRVPAPKIPSHEPGSPDSAAAQRGTHPVWARAERRDVPVYARAELRAGMCVAGYAIIEQYDATTVVLPGHVATVDPWLNLLIRPEAL